MYTQPSMGASRTRLPHAQLRLSPADAAAASSSSSRRRSIPFLTRLILRAHSLTRASASTIPTAIWTAWVNAVAEARKAGGGRAANCDRGEGRGGGCFSVGEEATAGLVTAVSCCGGVSERDVVVRARCRRVG